MIRHRARGAFALAMCLAVSQLACAVATTESAPALFNVAGTWSYAGTRSGESVATSGTLVLTQDQTVRFNGTLDATEQDALGEMHRIVGVVSGQTVDSSTVDFDVVVDPTLTRHHSGAMRGDSLTGTWVELSDRGVTASGSFRARRRLP